MNWHLDKTSELLYDITLDYDILICNEVSFNNSDNKLFIDSIYLGIIKALCDSLIAIFFLLLEQKEHFSP